MNELLEYLQFSTHWRWKNRRRLYNRVFARLNGKDPQPA